MGDRQAADEHDHARHDDEDRPAVARQVQLELLAGQEHRAECYQDHAESKLASVAISIAVPAIPTVAH